MQVGLFYGRDPLCGKFIALCNVQTQNALQSKEQRALPREPNHAFRVHCFVLENVGFRRKWLKYLQEAGNRKRQFGPTPRAAPVHDEDHLPSKERSFIERMTSDCKLKASKKGSKLSICGTQKTIHDVKPISDERGPRHAFRVPCFVQE